MATTSVKTPVKKAAVKQSTKTLHHKKVVKASVTSKHKLHKTARKTLLKKKV
jgi:hypothetical protein